MARKRVETKVEKDLKDGKDGKDVGVPFYSLARARELAAGIRPARGATVADRHQGEASVLELYDRYYVAALSGALAFYGLTEGQVRPAVVDERAHCMAMQCLQTHDLRRAAALEMVLEPGEDAPPS